jgi:hypothetical protein
MNECDGLRCGARTRAGTPCRRWAILPQGRCNLHGGKSRRGLCHPNFRHGRRSKDFLAQMYGWRMELETFAREQDIHDPGEIERFIRQNLMKKPMRLTGERDLT